MVAIILAPGESQILLQTEALGKANRKQLGEIGSVRMGPKWYREKHTPNAHRKI